VTGQPINLSFQVIVKTLCQSKYLLGLTYLQGQITLMENADASSESAPFCCEESVLTNDSDRSEEDPQGSCAITPSDRRLP
jgi:hypothetical protein